MQSRGMQRRFQPTSEPGPETQACMYLNSDFHDCLLHREDNNLPEYIKSGGWLEGNDAHKIPFVDLFHVVCNTSSNCR